MARLEELVAKVSGINVSSREIWAAIAHKKTTGRWFSHETERKKVARIALCIADAVSDPSFQKSCPTLVLLYHAYREASVSFVLMLTYADGLWLHADLRALISGQVVAGPSDRSHGSQVCDGYREKKLAGPGSARSSARPPVSMPPSELEPMPVQATRQPQLLSGQNSWVREPST